MLGEDKCWCYILCPKLSRNSGQYGEENGSGAKGWTELAVRIDKECKLLTKLADNKMGL